MGRLVLSENRVECHHQGEAYGEGEYANVGVAAGAHFGDEFFDDDVEHGTGGEGEEIGEHGHDEARGDDGQSAANRLDDARERAEDEGFMASFAARGKRQRDDGAFGEILDGDAE